jgi:hypothetical protein
MRVVWSGSKKELSNRKQKENSFYDFAFLGWWMKGKINALSCLGYGVIHTTLHG